jgi:hypothetical protein
MIGTFPRATVAQINIAMKSAKTLGIGYVINRSVIKKATA